MRIEDVKVGMWVRHADFGVSRVEKADGLVRIATPSGAQRHVLVSWLEPWVPRVGERVEVPGVMAGVGTLTAIGGGWADICCDDGQRYAFNAAALVPARTPATITPEQIDAMARTALYDYGPQNLDLSSFDSIKVGDQVFTRRADGIVPTRPRPADDT